MIVVSSVLDCLGLHRLSTPYDLLSPAIEDISGRHIAQRLVVPAEVVVVNEVSDGPLQLAGWKEGRMAQAKPGDTVKIHCTGRLGDGKVFKRSCESKPLKFKIGKSMLMRAFEQKVVGMKPGESRTVKVTADKAYGPRREEMVAAVDRKEFPDNVKPYVGLELDICQQDGKVFPAEVIEVSESSITLDANHPLAGKALIFDIELVELS